MLFFGEEIPRSPDSTVKIRFITGRGQPFVAWQGSGEANEAEVLREICESPIVCAYIKKAVANKRLKADENGAFCIPVKILVYDMEQCIYQSDKPREITIFPLNASAEPEGESAKHTVALDVIRTLVESMTQRDNQIQGMLDQVTRMQDSYEKTVAAISQHSLVAMDKVSSHAATAFSSAAAPFADMGKSLVKSIDDSRGQTAASAKEAQDLLIEALKNRIIESNQVSKPSIAQDIKDVMQLWPMFKGFLGEIDPKQPQ